MNKKLYEIQNEYLLIVWQKTIFKLKINEMTVFISTTFFLCIEMPVTVNIDWKYVARFVLHFHIRV